MTSDPSRTKVLVVDDHPVVRAGLISLINREEDLVACGEADDEAAALETAHARQPDVAVVDWSLGSRDAASLVQNLRTDHPRMPVLVLSVHDELYCAGRAVRAGASGYVMKHEASGKIITAIRAVTAGRRFLSERAAHAVAESSQQHRIPSHEEIASPARPARPSGPQLPLWAARLLSALIFLAVGFALYEFTLPFPFVFDDNPYLLQNPFWKDARSFLFLGDFSTFANRATDLGLDQDLSTNFILRPFAYFTFYVNHLVGGLQPAGYRAVNIFIHCANAALLHALVSRLLRAARGSAPAAGSGSFIAWTAALLFLVHPLQTESVTYIIQRFTSLGTFFFLGSVLLFVRARTAEDEAVARRCRRWSVAGLLVGMLTKEFLFIAPFAMVLLDRLMLGTPLREAGKRARPWLFCLPLIPALILFTTAAQSPDGLNPGAALNVAGPHGRSPDYPLHYALTQPGVILTYLRLLVFPQGLNLDPDYPLSTSPLEWRFLSSLGAILAFAGAAGWWAMRRSRDPRQTLGCCGVLWFFLTLSIDSSIVPLPDVMAEHRAYLPSVGFMIAVACLADLLRTCGPARSPVRWLIPAGAAVAVLALSAATVARNEVWRSAITLWKDTVAKSPKKARPWSNLGTSYFERGRWSRAVDCYRRAIENDPANARLWTFLANTENAAGRHREALASVAAGLRVDPAASELYLSRAYACERLGQPHEALAALQNALIHRPNSRRARLGIAGLSLEAGNVAETARQLDKLRSLGPLDADRQQVFDKLEAMLVRHRRALESASGERAPRPH